MHWVVREATRRHGSRCAERCKSSKSGSIAGTKRAERDVDGKVMNSRQLLQRLLLLIITVQLLYSQWIIESWGNVSVVIVSLEAVGQLIEQHQSGARGAGSEGHHRFINICNIRACKSYSNSHLFGCMQPPMHSDECKSPMCQCTCSNDKSHRKVAVKTMTHFVNVNSKSLSI